MDSTDTFMFTSHMLQHFCNFCSTTLMSGITVKHGTEYDVIRSVCSPQLERYYTARHQATLTL